MHLSGCGITARWRPLGEQRAAIPSGDPLGLSGYRVVDFPWSSTYRMGTRLFSVTAWRVSSLRNWTRPSPCATQIPREEPSIPRSMTAGLDWIATVTNRDSNRSDVLWVKQTSCLVAALWFSIFPLLDVAPTQPSNPISWQPLQTPRLNVSSRARKASNWARAVAFMSQTAAQPLAEPSTSA